MKIAVISDDGKTISQHFGRAPFYVILDVEDGKIVSREKVPKMGHNHFAGQEEAGGHEGPHGFDAASQSRHSAMANPIAGCQVLLAGGMGMGAYESLKQLNIEVIMTEKRDIEEAVKLYIEGKLENQHELLH